jgi:hypothetical protein
MTVWIVLSIIGVMLSPLIWLRPSRRQSGRMALRLEARRMGMGMQLAPQEWPHWLPVAPPSPCPQLHLPRRNKGNKPWAYWQTEPGTWVNRWREPCENEALLAQFSTLPADVYKVELDEQMIALYWAERGESEVLLRIAAVLKALA